jgi:hypothetical protein
MLRLAANLISPSFKNNLNGKQTVQIRNKHLMLRRTVKAALPDRQYDIAVSLPMVQCHQVKHKIQVRYCEECNDEAIHKRTLQLDCFTASGSQ